MVRQSRRQALITDGRGEAPQGGPRLTVIVRYNGIVVLIYLREVLAFDMPALQRVAWQFQDGSRCFRGIVALRKKKPRYDGASVVQCRDINSLNPKGEVSTGTRSGI